MHVEFNVNTDKIVVFTNKLEKLHRSAFPNAVRNTLNSLAMDVKQNSMPNMAKKKFVNRAPNFFKSNSRVDFASGFNVDRMSATVGFKKPGQKKLSQAVEDLEMQETGGIIGGRSFVPLNEARTAKSNKKQVARRNRIGNIKNIVRVSSTQGNNAPHKFVKSVYKAGVKGHILSHNTLFRIDSIRNNKFKLTALYNYKKGRYVTVKSTNFMEKSVKSTQKLTDKIYFKEAEKQFERHLR